MTSNSRPHAARALATCVATVLAGALVGGLLRQAPLEAGPRAKKRRRPSAGLVALDEPLALRFRRPVRGFEINEQTVRVLDPVTGELARGDFVPGALMTEPTFGRTVAVLPEAIEDYYRYVELRTRSDSATRTARLIRRIERTGRFALLDRIDRGLREAFGAAAGVGTRLDEAGVHGFFPPTGVTTGPAGFQRQGVAGDDALWARHAAEGDPGAFPELEVNSEYERFFHPINPLVGVRERRSVLAQRAHRRVLRSLRNRRVATFVPQLPTAPDASDAGLRSLFSYVIEFPERAVRPTRTALDTRGAALEFAGGFFRLPTRNRAPLFRAADEGGATPPDFRVVNVTPPNGERLVSPTTSWESPDNELTVPFPLRTPLVLHARFSDPLDPRSVDAASVVLMQVGRRGGETVIAVDPPVVVEAVATVRQSRLAEVAIDVRPVRTLDPDAQYRLRIDASVQSLSGVRLSADFESTFRTF